MIRSYFPQARRSDGYRTQYLSHSLFQIHLVKPVTSRWKSDKLSGPFLSLTEHLLYICDNGRMPLRRCDRKILSQVLLYTHPRCAHLCHLLLPHLRSDMHSLLHPRQNPQEILHSFHFLFPYFSPIV